MNHRFLLGLAGLAFTIVGSVQPAHADPLPRSSPEAQGVSSAAILEFVEEADRKIDSLHGFVLMRHGQVLASGWWSPYTPEGRHELYSLSKSFTSTAVGFVIAEGRLSLDDEVLKFFPADAPAEPSANLKAMRIRDLLCMSAGHEKEIPTSRDGMTTRAFLAQPVPFKPGTRFLYNTPATFMLSAIVQQVTGQTLLDYLTPRLFQPLGIEHPTWETNSQGISLGGYGLSVRTEDIARFGQFYLQRGTWEGKALLPASWVDAATARQTSNGSNPKSDWDQGYGYQFWRCRYGAYRGDGAFGQYCIVLPEQDAVVAITSGVKDMQAVLDLVWDRLRPAMTNTPQPANPTAEQALRNKTSNLTLPPVAGTSSSPLASKLRSKRFRFGENSLKLEWLELPEDAEGNPVLKLQFAGHAEQIVCGVDRWIPGRFAFGTEPERSVATSGAWTSDDTFKAKLCFNETPFTLGLKLRFSEHQVWLDSEYNVRFGPTQSPQLVGNDQ